MAWFVTDKIFTSTICLPVNLLLSTRWIDILQGHCHSSTEAPACQVPGMPCCIVGWLHQSNLVKYWFLWRSLQIHFFCKHRRHSVLYMIYIYGDAISNGFQQRNFSAQEPYFKVFAFHTKLNLNILLITYQMSQIPVSCASITIARCHDALCNWLWCDQHYFNWKTETQSHCVNKIVLWIISYAVIVSFEK